MKTFKIELNNENVTLSFGKDLASFLTSNDILVLSGDLGSGKTKLTQGILSYFGLEDEISSPTFTIVNEYNAKNMNIYHFDVYRLSDSSEFLEIGGEEYFGKGLCIIEWGEMILDVLPPDYIHIFFKRDFNDENKRILECEIHGNKGVNKFEDFINRYSK